MTKEDGKLIITCPLVSSLRTFKNLYMILLDEITEEFLLIVKNKSNLLLSQSFRRPVKEKYPHCQKLLYLSLQHQVLGQESAVWHTQKWSEMAIHSFLIYTDNI